MGGLEAAAPAAIGCLAFLLQLLGMAGGHWFSSGPQLVLGGHLQADLRKLATASVMGKPLC